MTVIEVRDLEKRYGETAAVRGVSFAIEAGEVFCLLGPNGAGKTTTAEIIEGHRRASSGSVSVLGRDPGKGERALRDRIGVVLQESSISQDLTVGELLDMHARWYTRSRPVAEVIALVELDASRGTRADTLSGGQRRRLDLALALVGDPDVLFLDEPTTGFDPHARRQAWTTIRSLCDLGKTVFLTTHYMDEAQHLADRVAVMVAGRIVAIGPPESIAGRDEQPTEIRVALPAGVGLADLPTQPGC
jgi:ABC-2 type transport system ATP-binding protein